MASCTFGTVRAQPGNTDCASAALLCAQQPISANNTGATNDPGFCAGTSSALWYTFTTNSQGGPVTVSLSGINCPAIADMDNELSVVVLNGDGSCLPNSFTAASACELDSVAFAVTTSVALPPNTTFWVLVSGAQNNGALLAAECGFTMELSGPGANIIGVDFSAPPDTTIGVGEFVQLNATGGTNWLWTPNSGLTADNIQAPIANPVETTIYTVSTQLNGCTYSDQVIVEVVRRISPPNTFTPNGDGINDVWNIFGIDNYPSCEVNIHDRWGQRVFRSIGYREPWDGTNNGVKLPMATYYYHILLNAGEGPSAPYTGSVTIIR